jgi:hypothetical protein
MWLIRFPCFGSPGIRMNFFSHIFFNFLTSMQLPAVFMGSKTAGQHVLYGIIPEVNYEFCQVSPGKK